MTLTRTSHDLLIKVAGCCDMKPLSSRRYSRGVVGPVDPLGFSARALLGFSRPEQRWKESVIWTHRNGYNTS